MMETLETKKGLIVLNKDVRTPRVRNLFIAYGEEKFIEEVLEKYCSDSEIGKICGQKIDWQEKLEKRLKEAATKATKV